MIQMNTILLFSFFSVYVTHIEWCYQNSQLRVTIHVRSQAIESLDYLYNLALHWNRPIRYWHAVHTSQQHNA